MKMKSHNFWYAVNNTEIVVMPRSYLETFGVTNLHYHLVSELMDSVDRIRVREGAIESGRPQIITPTYYESELLEGFGQEARQYVDWLRQHAKDLHILQYGFKLQKRELKETIVGGKLEEVTEQVKQAVTSGSDPLAAVVRGVDDLWDVCLLKLMVDVVRQSAPANFQELGRRRMLQDAGGVPRAVRQEIERRFDEAARNPERIPSLHTQLHRYGLFEEYEDRFFALVKQFGGQSAPDPVET
jgi:hypothetical protein